MSSVQNISDCALGRVAEEDCGEVCGIHKIIDVFKENRTKPMGCCRSRVPEHTFDQRGLLDEEHPDGEEMDQESSVNSVAMRLRQIGDEMDSENSYQSPRLGMNYQRQIIDVLRLWILQTYLNDPTFVTYTHSIVLQRNCNNSNRGPRRRNSSLSSDPGTDSETEL